MERINEQIRRDLADILRDAVKDPRVDTSLISILNVETTKDLKYCKVYVSVLGDEEKREQVRLALKSASGFIRKELAHRVNLRNTPELTFIMDDSIAYGIHMDTLFRKYAPVPESEADAPEDKADAPEKASESNGSAEADE